MADEQEGGFGALLHRHRAAAGLTQEELAERAGLSVRALRDMERGHTQRPYPHSVRLVADALTLTDQARAQLLKAARGEANGAAGASAAGASAGGAGGGSADGGPVVAQPGQPSVLVPRQLPALGRHFAGRADELMGLAALLDQPPGPAGTGMVVALTGTAGVGKTTLAVRWAYQIAARFPDGQLFINLRGFDLSGTPAQPDEVIRGFLEALQVRSADLPTSPAAQAGLYRSLTALRSILVVLDNARDADQVRPLLPGGRSCLVIVTSRNQLPGLAVAEGAYPVDIDVMSSADAEELLARRLGPERLAGEPRAVGELIALCARLPLAWPSPDRGAARPQVSLATAASQLHNVHARLDSLGTGEAATSVRAVFSWSYDLLPGPAARMFRLLGVHQGPDISVPAAASLTALPPSETAWLLRALNDAHLIEERISGRYAFHDLLRTYAAEQALAIDGPERCQAALGRVLDHYLHTGHAAALLLYPARERVALEPRRPGTRPESVADHAAALAWFTAEHETLLAACALAGSDRMDAHAWRLAWAMMYFLDLIGRWDELAATQKAALAAALRLDDQDGQAHAHCDLGRAYVRLGRLDDAVVQLRLALDLRAKFGSGAAQARIRLDIAQVAAGRKRYRKALGEAELALSLYQAAGAGAGQARALNVRLVGFCGNKLNGPGPLAVIIADSISVRYVP